MVKKNEKIQQRDEKLKVIFDAAREEGHKMVVPLLLNASTHIGLASSVLSIAYMWARLRFLAKNTERDCDDLFEEMLKDETKLLEIDFGKELDDALNKLKNKD